MALITFNADAQTLKLKNRVKINTPVSSGKVDDSIHYYFATGRGSNKMNDTILYDSLKVYNVKSGASLLFREYRMYDAKNNVQVFNQYDGVGLNLSDSFTYTLSNKLLTLRHYERASATTPGPIRLIRNYVNTYDVKDRLILEESAYYKPGVDTSYEKWYHFYDANGRVTSDSARVQRWTDSIFRNAINYYYKYNTSGLLVERLQKIWKDSLSKYDSGLVTTYFYDINDRLIADTARTKTGFVYETHEYDYDGAGNMLNDTGRIYYSSSPTLIFSETYTYTNTGNLKTKYYHTHSAGSSSYGDQLLIYNYDTLLSVPEMSEIQNVALTLYPNPTQSILNIKAKWKAEGELQGAVTDMQGRVVMRWSEKADEQYNRQIQLAQLQTGMYFLNLSCGDEYTVKQFVVR
ncbi:MAG: T9SS type A sorting domain-containing protein [Chitinophagales bacterium]|nr:T9SS type A sorting domain-containing protein [Chitinophagaceae bacterium]MCB9066162.1 T9SS type A sorting domain-containing protein [Chitinophagales bacterium]